MAFGKKKEKALYPLVLTGAESEIDWEQVARNIYRKKSHLRILQDQELKSASIELSDEQKEEFYVSRQSVEGLREAYVDSKFDYTLLAGDFDTLLFEGFTADDLNFWDLSKVKNENKETISKELKEFIEKFLKEKLHAVEFRPSLPKEDYITKEEVIKQFMEEMTLDQVNYLSKFIAVMIEGKIAKKKTLTSTAV